MIKGVFNKFEKNFVYISNYRVTLGDDILVYYKQPKMSKREIMELLLNAMENGNITFNKRK